MVCLWAILVPARVITPSVASFEPPRDVVGLVLHDEKHDLFRFLHL